MPTLHLVVGLPGAGKTTRAREIEREHGALRLTPDEWMEHLSIDLRDEKRREEVEALLWRVASRALERGVDVVLDFGFWSRSERDDFRGRASALGASTEVYFLDVPRAELLARRAARGTSTAYTVDELDVWIRQFEVPVAEELSPVADDDHAEWFRFYRDFFPDDASAMQFVRDCEDKQPRRHPSRLIMHQCKRLVSVARDVRRVQPSYHSFQILLTLVCAEAVAKLHDRELVGPRKSKQAVRHFFATLLPEEQRARLVMGMRILKVNQEGPGEVDCTGDEEVPSVERVAELLYRVRCDVAHEGQYGSVFFSRDGTHVMSRGWPLSTSLTLDDMDEIVVAGCVWAARSRLGEDGIEVPRPRRA